MNIQSKKIRYIILMLIMAINISMLTGCGAEEKKTVKIESVQDFNDKKLTIGVISGYIFGEEVETYLPEAKTKVYYSREEAYKGLQIGEVDGVADDEPAIRARMRSDDSVSMADGYVDSSEYSFLFQKNEWGETLSKQFSEYIAKLKESGELAQLDEKWFGKNTENKVSEDYSTLPDTNGTLNITYEGADVPFAYTSRDKPVGYEIDIAIGFCKEYGYGLNIVKREFQDTLEGIKSGEYDAGCGAITITEARKKDYCFGAADYEGGIGICIRSVNNSALEDKSKNEFERSVKKTFLDHDRYKLFLKGILLTLLITICSVLGGTILGVIFYILSKRGNGVVRLIIRMITGFIHLVPAVMLVMLIYYSFYSRLTTGGIIAAISAFTLVFSDDVYRVILKNAKARKNDELQEQYRLEYIDTKEFFDVLFKRKYAVIDDYKEKIITLIKMTAVVGYVSVQDMTRVFDVVRRESLETMTPLIATTALYFLLILIITVIFDRIGNSEPKNKEKKKVSEENTKEE